MDAAACLGVSPVRRVRAVLSQCGYKSSLRLEWNDKVAWNEMEWKSGMEWNDYTPQQDGAVGDERPFVAVKAVQVVLSDIPS